MSGELKCGDKILLSGIVYTARDAAHKRFNALLDEGKELPIPLKDAVIYYAGPTPAPEGKPIGSCGPTTSGRMDRRNDWQGREITRGKGRRDKKWCGLSLCYRRCGRTCLQLHKVL